MFNWLIYYIYYNNKNNTENEHIYNTENKKYSDN